MMAQPNPILGSTTLQTMSLVTDEASKISFEEDDRSSMDGSVKPTRIFERVIEVDSSPSAAEPVPEATESEFVKLGSGSSKNFRKKSRISAARAAFEED